MTKNHETPFNLLFLEYAGTKLCFPDEIEKTCSFKKRKKLCKDSTPWGTRIQVYFAPDDVLRIIVKSEKLLAYWRQVAERADRQNFGSDISNDSEPLPDHIAAHIFEGLHEWCYDWLEDRVGDSLDFSISPHATIYRDNNNYSYFLRESQDQPDGKPTIQDCGGPAHYMKVTRVANS